MAELIRTIRNYRIRTINELQVFIFWACAICSSIFFLIVLMK
jgi:hypothetical protein